MVTTKDKIINIAITTDKIVIYLFLKKTMISK